jgi:GTPase SAR1 family protein
MVYYYKTTEKRVHNKCFPSNFRMLIVGASGAGKTALLMRMLLDPDLLNYEKLYVFAKSLYQPEYQVLRAGLENGLPKTDIIKLMNSDTILKKNNTGINEAARALAECNEENEIEPSNVECELHDSSDEIPDPKDLDKNLRNLIVFDDVMTDKKQTLAENYYTRGRSANCDCIYLSQNYTHLPLHTIRSNSNFMIFFKSSPRVVEQLHRDFAEVDLPLKQFKHFCNSAWQQKHGFIVIDPSRDFKSSNKYRSQLNLAN